VKRRLLYSLLFALLAFAMAKNVAAATIDFDGLARGEIVSDQFSSLGVTVFSEHFSDSSANAAIVFDTLFDGPVDRDLQGPSFAGGNRSSSVFGNILILPENLDDDDANGRVDTPNDEGSRPAGVLGFIFATPIVDFSLDLIDIEPPGEMGRITFISDGSEAFITFEELASANASILFIDNGANHINTIFAADFGFASFDEVHIRMGGSGGIDNIMFTTVPEPGVTLMYCAGLTGLALLGCRRR
jgi:hypothetical protein